MLAGFLLTLAATVVLSRGRIFWEDETLGWMLLHDPSWRHMVTAWKMGADGGGFFFYLTGRLWFFLLGASDLSFRLYSSTCFGLAFAVTWIAARRYYRTGVVAFALFNTWFFSPPLVMHMHEGRFYGLLILCVSLAFWLNLVLADLPTSLSEPVPVPVPVRWYAALFLVHGMLVTSHLLGVVFSAFLLGGLLATDLARRRRRPGLYLAGAAAWLLLLPERSNLVASANVGRPHFWTKAPTKTDILMAYTGSSKEITAVLAVLFCLGVWRVWRSRHDVPSAVLATAFQQRLPLYLSLFALLLVPVGFLLEGLVGTWLFNSRYLLPITVGTAYLTAELLQLAEPRALWKRFAPRLPLPHGRILRGIAAIGYAACLLWWVFDHLRAFTPSQPAYTARLTAMLPRSVPVVCEDAFSFTELVAPQHADGVRFMFLLDWPQALSPSAPLVEVTQYHLMEIWKKVGYFSSSIEDLPSFLGQHRRFLVVHAGPPAPLSRPPDIGNPLTQRFEQSPAYEVRPYAVLDRGAVVYTVSLVCLGKC